MGIPPATIWSSCSVETLHNTLEAVLCLDNEPSITSTDTACGNGIREEGEACDCGSVEVRHRSVKPTSMNYCLLT